MTKKCAGCGKEFTPREPHHTCCWDCYKNQPPAAGGNVHPEQRSDINLDEYWKSSSYANANGYLREEFVTTWAYQIAYELGNGKMTKHQLRRYYNHAKYLQRRLAVTQNSNYDSIAAELKELKPFAHNAANSSTNKVPKLFVNFIDLNLDNVHDRKSFDYFMIHFQAVVGYAAEFMRE